ncbi:hypothetical protein MGYG_08448 [Nannizzia gypsea CBS 118893]|uniref:Uncharacterized protein n=1 Tax=Arthroderma gypseum (strain ATCC MYA-4604 / CBS 118893) TaxID=535722 RepID=E4V5R1_ARTGP|nr:hypothetical protein MGYG_08448 [Nannizzia gypsea CBS 118893]EFR05436.1 hypothetical protein MGYG_08448 [Nannizzia gypsea CBS 118893]
MSEKRIRASKLPRFTLPNIVTNRQGEEWMDGIPTLDFDYFPPFQHVIPEEKLSSSNLPPFYRLLCDAQALALSKWGSKGNMAKELLGLYWPADFNADGKLKRNRISWNIGTQARPAQRHHLTHQSCGRPMKSMPVYTTIIDDEADDDKPDAIEKSPSKAERPCKVVLLHDSRESERVVELEYEIDKLRASLKRSESQLEGLRCQVSQVETAMSVRSELVTNAIVNYHFSRANLELLAPSISSLVDESVSADDLSELAGGAATLDHRIKVIQEVARRLRIPVTIPPEIIGEPEDSDLPVDPRIAWDMQLGQNGK